MDRTTDPQALTQAGVVLLTRDLALQQGDRVGMAATAQVELASTAAASLRLEYRLGGQGPWSQMESDSETNQTGDPILHAQMERFALYDDYTADADQTFNLRLVAQSSSGSNRAHRANWKLDVYPAAQEAA